MQYIAPCHMDDCPNMATNIIYFNGRKIYFCEECYLEHQNGRDEFLLRNDPPKVKHDRGEFCNLERTKQAKLITGLDCLPGQEDLF
jgi:Zn-finger protein